MKSIKILFFICLVFSTMLCGQQIKKAKQEPEKVPKTAESLVCIALKKAVKIAVQTNNRASLDVLPEELRVFAYLLYDSLTSTDPNRALLQLLNYRNIDILKNCNIDTILSPLFEKVEVLTLNLYKSISSENLTLDQCLKEIMSLNNNLIDKIVSHLPTKKFNLEIVTDLVRALPNINVKFANDETLLLILAKKLYEINETVAREESQNINLFQLNLIINFIKILINHNIDINAQDTLGNTALMYIACTVQPLKSGDIISPFSILNLILNQPSIAVNLVNNNHENVLCYFLKNHSDLVNDDEFMVKIVQILIKAGVNINVQNINGNTPLMLAAYLPDVKIVEELLHAHANIHQKNSLGETALIQVIMAANEDLLLKDLVNYEEYQDIIKLLLENGADLFAQDNSNKTALDYATSPELREFLEKSIKEQEKK